MKLTSNKLTSKKCLQLLNNWSFNEESMSTSKIFTTNVRSSLNFSFSSIILSTFATICLAVRTKKVFNNIPFRLAHKLEKFLDFLLAVVGSGIASLNLCKQVTKCFLCKFIFHHKRQYQNNAQSGCYRRTRK